MVTTRLYGRMGNQCYQIAAAMALALRNGDEYFIPERCIGGQVPYFTHFPKLGNRKPKSTYREKGHEYNPIVYTKDMQLDGYWQSHLYWKDFEKEVLDSFNIQYEPVEGLISIHKRLGDYLKYPTKHPIITDEYITKAIRYFQEKGYRKFLVFSDEIQKCKKQFTSDNFEGCDFYFSEGRTPIKDLTLMASCEHQIISNSTFSLWAHYFNRNPDKICVAPEVWFGKDNSNLNTKDIYPENCVKF